MSTSTTVLDVSTYLACLRHVVCTTVGTYLQIPTCTKSSGQCGHWQIWAFHSSTYLLRTCTILSISRTYVICSYGGLHISDHTHKTSLRASITELRIWLPWVRGGRLRFCFLEASSSIYLRVQPGKQCADGPDRVDKPALSREVYTMINQGSAMSPDKRNGQRLMIKRTDSLPTARD